MPEHPFFDEAPGVRIIAHRGFVSRESRAAGVIDNTFQAITDALAEGAEVIETDIRFTSDGRAVLFHDAHLREVTGERLAVAKLTHAQLTHRLRDRGGLLTIEETLEAFPTARFNVDVKSADVAEHVGRVVGPHAPRVLVASFSAKSRAMALEAARHQRARGGEGDSAGAGAAEALPPATSASQRDIVQLLLANTMRLQGRVGRVLGGLHALQVPVRQGPLRVLTPRLIAAAHRHGVEVHVWTVNEADEMRRLAALGVDGIVTDRTDLAVATLRQ